MAHQWRGLIEEYRDRLPVTDKTPNVTLLEGGTPLNYACVLSEMTGAQAQQEEPKASQRVLDALFSGGDKIERERQEMEVDASFTVSDREVLERKDFAQMTAAEIAAAKDAINRMVLGFDDVKTRRLKPHPQGHQIDLRRTLRASMKGGGALIDLKYLGHKTKTPPIVALLGPTLAERSMPWRDPRWFAEAVQVEGLACRPCHQRTCVPGDFRCLTGITPEQVVAAFPARFGLYLHVPFCRKMCWYCGCHTRVAKDDVPVQAYTSALRREVADQILPRLAREAELHRPSRLLQRPPKTHRQGLRLRYAGRLPQVIHVQLHPRALAARPLHGQLIAPPRQVRRRPDRKPRLARRRVRQQRSRELGTVKRDISQPREIAAHDLEPRLHAALDTARLQPRDGGHASGSHLLGLRLGLRVGGSAEQSQECQQSKARYDLQIGRAHV